MVVNVDNRYIKESSSEKTLYENIINDNFLYIILYKDFAEIKFNIIELVLVKDIDILCNEFIEGNYTIKFYLSNKNLLHSKLVWHKKELRKYNQKTKYGFLRCKKINRIETIQGIIW